MVGAEPARLARIVRGASAAVHGAAVRTINCIARTDLRPQVRPGSVARPDGASESSGGVFRAGEAGDLRSAEDAGSHARADHQRDGGAVAARLGLGSLSSQSVSR